MKRKIGDKLLFIAAVFLICCYSSKAVNSEWYTNMIDVKFVNATRETGIDFIHFNGTSGTKYLVKTMGAGAAFFDYDVDGDLDIYIVNGADLADANSNLLHTDVLYRNDGDGHFTDVTQVAKLDDKSYGMGCAVGDYNNDGFPDLYVTNFGVNVLYKNNGDGTFSNVTKYAKVGDSQAPHWSSSAAFLDYDNDGDLDLYVTNYLDYQSEINKLSVLPDTPFSPRPINYPGSADTLYQNNGDETFSDVTQQTGIYNPEGKGLGIVCGDYNNDGFLDIFVANDTTPNSLYKNNGNRTFTDIALLAGVAYSEDGSALAGMGVDFGDYDNDSLLDIFVTNFSYEYNSLYRNQGDGTFKNMIHESGIGEVSFLPLGFGAGFLDYDNDRFMDIFVANGHVLDNINIYSDNLTYAQRPQLFHNNGDSTYLETSAMSGECFSKPMVSRGVAFGDYDNDGDPDIFVINLNANPVLLRNDGGNLNHWLMIKTIGTKSNRDGIGARVKLVSKSGTQIREVKPAYSYLSSNDPRLLFGLGEDSKVDFLQIRWPSGSIQEIKNLDPDQIIKIIEGQSEIESLRIGTRLASRLD